jgi:hypothetical protein
LPIERGGKERPSQKNDLLIEKNKDYTVKAKYGTKNEYELPTRTPWSYKKII